MGEFVFDIQRFSNLGTLKTLGGIIKTLGLVKLAQDLNKAKDASKWLKENANPILKFIGSTPFGKKFGSYSALITNSILIVDNALSVLTDKTLPYATRNSKIGAISSSLLSMANATNKLSTSLKKKNLWFLSIFSGGISLAANLIAASDGVTLEEKKAINKSYVAFLTSLGSDLVKEIFSAAVEKQLSRAFKEELTTDLVEEIMTKGKFFQAASKTLTKTFGVVLSLATGALNAIDEHKARMEKYTEDGIPEDIAKHDAFIDAFATFVHDNLSVYFKGVDNWVFEFMLGVVGGETEKNYIEVIADRFKTLNYKNSGTSGDDSQETFIVSFDNKSYIYGDNGNDSIQNVASNATIWGGHDNDTIWSVKHESKTPARNSIFGGPGNDFIAVQDTQSTIYGGKGNDFLLTQGTKNIIYGDAGNDSIVIDASATGNSIYGGLGDDLIFIESGAKKNKFFYTAGDGNDTIYNFGASDSLTVSGKFSTVKSGSDINVKVGNGSILLVGAADKKIYINGNIFNDDPINSGTFTPIPYPTLPSAPESPLISGTSGDDTIENYRSNVFINSGAGNDFIDSEGDKVTIDGGTGDDIIDNEVLGEPAGGSNVSINGGAGNDLIENDGDSVTLNGGIGNDYIENWAGGTFIFDDKGDDKIYSSGSNVTIAAGAGNDNIFNGDYYDSNGYYSYAGSKVLFVYSVDDGNDIISGFNETSTLQIGGGTGTYFSKRSGDDVIVTVGKGKITLQGAANLSLLNILNIDGVWKDPTLLTVTNSTKSPVTVDSAVETVDASSRTKAVKITGNALANTISGGSANDTLSGEAGNDSIKGGSGNDSINGGEGNDRIAGDTGKDTIFGGNGNDFLYGGADDDTLSGDAGNDTLNGAAGNDSIKGGAGNDSINGGDGNDRIAGDAGKDTIFGGNGNDFLYGGTDDDTISGDAGNDTLNGASGNDSLKGGDGNDSINGGDGADRIAGDAGKDTIFGGNGNDFLYGGTDDDTLSGDTGNDTLNGAAGNDSIKGGEGNDSLSGGQGDDTLNGGDDNDKLFGGKGYDSLNGENGNDTLSGGDDDDKLLGGAGNDSLSGDKGNDTLDGGAANDKLFGGAGNDSLSGGAGNDTLDGGADSDKLYGGAGNDCIKGGTGKDSLWGGAGNDTLWGDDGADNFFYAKGDGKDVIYGFDGKDTLTFDNLDFTTSYNKSKGTITFKVDSGSVTLKDFTATTFHINSDTYKISGSTLKKQ